MTSGALPAMLLNCAVGGFVSAGSMAWVSTISIPSCPGSLLESVHVRHAALVVGVEDRHAGPVGKLAGDVLGVGVGLHVEGQQRAHRSTGRRPDR